MPQSADENVTQVLAAASRGEAGASERLLPLVYGELRKLAASRMSGLAPGQTLEPTALVHEAYLRLVGQTPTDDMPRQWDGRGHFFAAAARAMRNILVDQARRKNRLKHGGNLDREPLDDLAIEDHHDAVDHLALDAALRTLEADDPLKCDIVMMRYYAGLSVDETASALNVSPATVDRLWSYARAWLRRELDRS